MNQIIDGFKFLFEIPICKDKSLALVLLVLFM